MAYHYYKTKFTQIDCVTNLRLRAKYLGIYCIGHDVARRVADGNGESSQEELPKLDCWRVETPVIVVGAAHSLRARVVGHVCTGKLNATIVKRTT